MATIRVDGDHIAITLTTFEKVAGLFGDQRIALADVSAVALEANPHPAITGLRAPGLAIPGRTKIGTWRGKGRRMFICVRKSAPAVRIETPTAPGYKAYLVSVDQAPAVVEQINAALASRG